MRVLHGIGLFLLPVCGWLCGDAVQMRTDARLSALQAVLALLQRIRQEIGFRRADLQSLYRQFCREGLLPQRPGVETLQQLPAPEALSKAERACFAECISGLGRTEAEQECQRLAYYIARFEAFLQQAQRTAQAGAGLPHRLGFAAGLMLTLVFF